MHRDLKIAVAYNGNLINIMKNLSFSQSSYFLKILTQSPVKTMRIFPFSWKCSGFNPNPKYACSLQARIFL